MKLPINEVKLNPKNPRFIKDDNFAKLVESLKTFPEMAEVREVVVNKDHVILGGNMRYRAMKEAGWSEVPVKVVDWDQSRQDEFMIKDNVAAGEWDWDLLANEWDQAQLDEWGVDMPAYEEPEIELSAEAKDGIQQMTFILSDSQVEEIKTALAKARNLIDGSEENQNTNGNALFYIAKEYNGRS